MIYYYRNDTERFVNMNRTHVIISLPLYKKLCHAQNTDAVYFCFLPRKSMQIVYVDAHHTPSQTMS